jgi:CheY-like chemotaxis protein
MTHKILCVEDNPQNMRLVRKILQHKGYEVIEAENGVRGVELALEGEADLILMDINLPDIDGREATQRIKIAHPDIPIIALTANAMYGDEERMLSAGCDGYISKPISKDDLLELVEKFLTH